MPSLEENKKHWTEYSWETSGEEWSREFGSSSNIWHAILLPRLLPFLPARRLLEIAPGYGRITHFIKDHCDELTLVDVTENCIAACKERFAEDTHIKFHVNDGKSLDAIPEESIDFAFSFDSLVHVDMDVLGAYLGQLAGKLSEQGVAFLHHSNLAAVITDEGTLPEVPAHWSGSGPSPKPFRNSLGELPAMPTQWRDPTVSAASFRRACDEAGLVCSQQELLNWGSNHLIDCFSVVARPSSPQARDFHSWENPDFMLFAGLLREASRGYERLRNPGCP